MNNPPLPSLLRICAYCIPPFFLPASSLHAQIGGGSETLLELHGIASSDDFGRAVAGGGDVNGDGTPDIIVGAPDTDVGGGFNQGSVYVYSGVDGSLLHQWDGQSTTHYLFGERVACAGDVNADGFDDVIVSATHASPGGISHAGSVFVYSGANGALLYVWHGTSSWEGFGDSISGAGDVNADGFDDMIISAPEANTAAANNAGSAFVYSGKDGTLLYRFDGNGTSYAFAHCASGAGDVNNDGHADLMVSGHYSPSQGSSTIRSTFVYSGADGSQLFRFDGERGNDNFGRTLAAAGDVNADGFADMLVGASQGGMQNGGAAFVFSGIDGSPMYGWHGDTAGARFGYRVAAAGDTNGDGFDDVLVSEFAGEYAGSGYTGKVFLYSGSDGILLQTWGGSSYDDFFGVSISSAGDLDSNGCAELIIGASRTEHTSFYHPGAAFVYSFEPFLYASSITASAAGSTVIQLDFDFPTAASFHQYKLLISASGMGSTFYGVQIPLIMDNMFGRSFMGNYPVSAHANLHGTLDAFGDSSGSITLPAGINPSLIGATYHCAAISNAPGQLPSYSSAALPLTITL